MDARHDRLSAPLAIPTAVRAALAAHAQAAFPHECCGYLVGPRGGSAVTAAVACANASPEPTTAFEIAGPELLALVRGLAGDLPALAIYHSHTNGRAYFSPRDAALAATDAGPIYPVAHVVLGVTAAGVAEAACFAWSAAAHAYVEVDRW